MTAAQQVKRARSYEIFMDKAALRQKGITISDFDLLIASFASVHNLCVVTNNKKHFQHIEDFEIQNWLTDN